MKHQLINADSLDYLRHNTRTWHNTIFADPPDNIGLKYDGYKDDMPDDEYVRFLKRSLHLFVRRAETVWFSFNAKWIFAMGRIVEEMLESFLALEAKPCVQTFTFGQHNNHDLGNNHRPLWRIGVKGTTLWPDAVRVQSCRQKCGDKRANPNGRVPGDVFDFPRVVGNSRQRRSWHSTQLHEGLVERCLLLTTPKGGSVLDPFAGTGTTLRVCKRLDFNCTLIEQSAVYCNEIAKEHKLQPIRGWNDRWERAA